MEPQLDFYIQKLPFGKFLTDAEREKIIRSATFLNFKKGESIRSCGADVCLGLVCVTLGAIRVTIMSEEGREVTLFNVPAGEICILSASCVISQIKQETLMLARENTQIMVINSATFQSLMESNIHVKCFAYELATQRFSTALWVLQEIIFKGFDKRLASYLINRCIALKTKELNTTQDEIAVDVGSSREVVTRMLKHFMNDDIISVKRGNIIIKDLEALQYIAGDKLQE